MNTKITRNFTLREISCNCGRNNCNAKSVNGVAVERLQKLRDLFDKPMVITSGVRCTYWNSAVGGKPHSLHLDGKAFDIYVPNSGDRFLIVYLAMSVGFTGIGVAENFVHIDIRERGKRKLWTYR